MSFGIGSVIGGLIYLGLGLLVRLRSQPTLSMIALILGILLLVVDGIANIVAMVRNPISGKKLLPHQGFEFIRSFP
ncbi:MAG: hypothetical protein AAF215_29945 [Cyanobacteria bacterium P01_A01_bin.123]